MKESKIERIEKREGKEVFKPEFDPEKELTEKDRQIIKEEIQVNRDDDRFGSPIRYTSLAADIRILFPEAIADKEFELSSFTFGARHTGRMTEGYNSLAGDLRSIENIRDPNPIVLQRFIHQIRDMKIAEPYEVRNMEIENKRYWGEARDLLEEYRDGAYWYNFVQLAADLKIIFGEERFKSKFSLDDKKAWQEIWSGTKNALDALYKDKNWKKLLPLASDAKILFPEKAAEINLNRETWQGLKKVFEGSTKEDTLYPGTILADRAARMKILAADKIEIEDKYHHFKAE